MSALDQRLHAYRNDLADEALHGRVVADRYVTSTPYRVEAHFADILRRPEAGAGLDTQCVHGTILDAFDTHGDWVWVQSKTDGYVGYTKRAALSSDIRETTHCVTAPRTFLYPEPDLKAPRCGYLSMGSQICVKDYAERRGTQYAILDNGQSIIANHIAQNGAYETDYVSVAERLLHTPYLWGGTTGFGIDCSGLVQLSLSLIGHHALRDTDMQENHLGTLLDCAAADLKRGDLVFWKGHVAIVSGPNKIIHANGHSMNVAEEPLDDAIERIAYLYEKPTCFKRI